MKRFIYHITTLLVAGALLTGCAEDPLNLSPLSAIGENGFYTNADEVEGAVIAIYDGLQEVPLREFALTEMRSDNTKTKTSEGDWAQFESYEVQPTNLAIGTYWSANYNVIFRANRVLENLEVVESAALRDQFEGEAKFARALAHFNLTNAFGGVPIVDQVIIQTDTDYFAQDAAADVLNFIASDLTDASGKLPDRASMDEGRATSGAATALLAKVLLTQGKYSEAEGLLSGLLNDANYALMDTYSDVFYSEGNSEIIFAILYVDDDANESQDFSFEMTAGGAVSGLNYLTDDFKAAMDTADAERAAVFMNPNNENETGKWLTRSADARLCGNDWIVLRLADVYLMHAEAILGASLSTNNLSAIRSYNAVRTRVGLSTLAEDGSAELTRDMLLLERRMELAFENHRLYDLIRFGVAQEVLSAFAAATNESFQATDLLLPIPQGEINVSDGLLKQNPGY
ncbi:MAG: RagB/SusD family nutrient uptake outer membrane protein [Bacteroidota bacterium]